MSLMRLLSSGKSWVGVKDSGVRYRMTDPKAMPKFGSDRNLFRATTKAPLSEAVTTLPRTLESRRDEQEQMSDLSQSQPERANEPVSPSFVKPPASEALQRSGSTMEDRQVPSPLHARGQGEIIPLKKISRFEPVNPAERTDPSPPPLSPSEGERGFMGSSKNKTR